MPGAKPKYITLTCTRCEKPFVKRLREHKGRVAGGRVNVYCSKMCAHPPAVQLHLRCLGCGKLFWINAADAKYRVLKKTHYGGVFHSRECYMQHRWEKHPTSFKPETPKVRLVCAQCKKEFFVLPGKLRQQMKRSLSKIIMCSHRCAMFFVWQNREAYNRLKLPASTQC